MLNKTNIQIDINDITEEEILAYFLLRGNMFCNNGWWDEKWPNDCITLHVNCNDVFGYACADAEDITHSELRELFNMHKKDLNLGIIAWCIKKRKILPLKEVQEWIIKDNIWNLENLIKGKT